MAETCECEVWVLVDADGEIVFPTFGETYRGFLTASLR